jgi:hypothetical protein
MTRSDATRAQARDCSGWYVQEVEKNRASLGASRTRKYQQSDVSAGSDTRNASPSPSDITAECD